MKEFHHISLCNVSYKTVTKIFARRLKYCMHKTISRKPCRNVASFMDSVDSYFFREIVGTLV